MSLVHCRVLAALAVISAATAPGHAEAPAETRGYYREPALRGDVVVFTAEGDLWTVAASGGSARRLTSHPGEELHAAISPDGSTLAFTGAYEGPSEVYTMPLAGGLPVRRTWDGGDDARVVGFDPGGRVLYATRHESGLPDWQVLAIDLTTGTRQPLPLSQASDAAWDAPGGSLFFTRPAFQGSHTKRYVGGTAQKLWVLRAGAAEANALTADWAGTSRQPMPWQGRVYFVSDRDGTQNLWSMHGDGSDLRQHTHHVGWDVLAPTLDDGRIVYQLGADLRLLDLRSGNDRELAISLQSDLDQRRQRWISDAFEWLTSAHLAPKGDALVLTARGQVFVAPTRQGRLVEASRAPGVRYRQARFLGDGKALVALSDESGEVEAWRLPADGLGTRQRLTQDGHVLRFDGVPAPDGQQLAVVDKNHELWLYDLARGGRGRRVLRANFGVVDVVFSPDSRWLAYSAGTSAGFSQIFICDVETLTSTAVTSTRVDSFSPAFSADGKWLYFLSDRNLQSVVEAPWGALAPEPFFDRKTRLYLAALPGPLRSPFQPHDELEPSAPSPSPTPTGTRPSPSAPAPDGKPAAVQVERTHLASRVQEVPGLSGNYQQLVASATRLFFLSTPTGVDAKHDLVVLDIANDNNPQVKTLVEDVQDFEVSADGKKLLVRRAKDMHVVDAGSEAPARLDKTRVDLSAWRFTLDPREEWRQMFDEAWRLHRDYFYDPGMHAVDWPGLRARYRPLVERVTDRRELSDLLAQMVGELSALHTFVRGGERRQGIEQIEPASLGARLVRDVAAGGARVARLYRADPDYPDRFGPLQRAGVDIAEGDVILTINGVGTLTVADPGVLLRDQVGRQVRLRVRSAGGQERDVIVQPLAPAKATELRYDDWELTRRERVEQLGAGRLGYVHLRAMGTSDMAQWARNFYPVFDRDGLIIDMRHNRGGNIDSWLLGRLLRRAWMFWQARVGPPYWNMQMAFRGHLVVLIDEATASDGEAFAEGFRRLGLGKLIGTRTWGGEIWLTSSNTLVDKGIASAAEFGVFGPEGQWLIEGHGVEPDITVDNLPRATFDGHDAQLEAAIAHLQQRLRDEPIPVPVPPAYPDKSAPYNRRPQEN